MCATGGARLHLTVGYFGTIGHAFLSRMRHVVSSRQTGVETICQPIQSFQFVEGTLKNPLCMHAQATQDILAGHKAWAAREGTARAPLVFAGRMRAVATALITGLERMRDCQGG